MASDPSARVDEVINAVRDELARAMTKHSSMTNGHEAYAVILEELDEFWDEVKLRADRRSPEKMREELLQTAAMALRAIVDLRL